MLQTLPLVTVVSAIFNQNFSRKLLLLPFLQVAFSGFVQNTSDPYLQSCLSASLDLHLSHRRTHLPKAITSKILSSIWIPAHALSASDSDRWLNLGWRVLLFQLSTSIKDRNYQL